MFSSRGTLLFCWIIVIGFLWQAAEVLHQIIAGSPFPLSPPFHYPRDVFMDFFNTNHAALNSHPYRDAHVIYGPFNLLIAKGFALMADYSTTAGRVRLQFSGLLSLAIFLGLFGASLLWTARETVRRLKTKGETEISGWSSKAALVYAAFFLNAPVLMTIDRGNYVILAFFFFSPFILSRNKRSWLSMLSLVCACSIKPYLLLCLIPIAVTYGFRYVLQCGLFFIVFNGGAALLLRSSDVMEWLPNMLHYGDTVTLAHRLYGSINLSNILSPGAPLALGLHMNTPSIGLYLAMVTYLCWMAWGRYTLEQKLFCITVVAITLPSLAYAYNLILLLPFCAILLETQAEPWGHLSMVLLALSLVFWNHVCFFSGPMRGIPPSFELKISEEPIVLPILLVTLLVVTALRWEREPLNDRMKTTT